jgi:hypothetical protein
MRWYLATALALVPSLLHADGGTVRFAGRCGGYQITAFTTPTPPRAGDIDVSVLAQDAHSGVPLADVEISVRLSAAGQRPLQSRATREAATNKLLYAAIFTVPAAGRWRVDIAIDGERGPAHAAFEMDVAEPLPPWRELWPWIAFPVVPVALFVLHQWLSRTKKALRLFAEGPRTLTEI